MCDTDRSGRYRQLGSITQQQHERSYNCRPSASSGLISSSSGSSDARGFSTGKTDVMLRPSANSWSLALSCTSRGSPALLQALKGSHSLKSGIAYMLPLLSRALAKSKKISEFADCNLMVVCLQASYQLHQCCTATKNKQRTENAWDSVQAACYVADLLSSVLVCI